MSHADTSAPPRSPYPACLPACRAGTPTHTLHPACLQGCNAFSHFGGVAGVRFDTCFLKFCAKKRDGKYKVGWVLHAEHKGGAVCVIQCVVFCVLMQCKCSS